MVLGLTEDRPEVESAIHRVIDRGWFVLGRRGRHYRTIDSTRVARGQMLARRFGVEVNFRQMAAPT